MTEELVKYNAEQGVKVFQPVMSIEDMKDRYQMMARITGEIMREGQDYGAIPGTGGKPSLFKPGAEKLATFFGLRKEFEIIEREEDWVGAEHGGEPFFYYLVRCLLYRDDVLVAAADGSCNSWESRYRYRKASRVCPHCGADAIIKGKAEYGGGWLCFKKKGGCGAKFQDGDKAIEGQQTGRILNTDIFDQVNTVLKMAEKRSLVATTLLAVGASEFFTQDMEDIIDVEWTEHPPEPKRNTSQAQKPPQVQANKPDNGNGRPWAPNVLKTNLLKKAEHYRNKNEGTTEPPEDGVRGYCASLLNQRCGNDDRRHVFLKYIYGDPSIKARDRADIIALTEWAEGQHKNGVVKPEVVDDEASRLVNGIVGEQPDDEPNDVG